MLKHFFPQGHNILLSIASLSLLISCSASSQASPLAEYVGTYRSTSVNIDGEIVDAEEFGFVGLSLKQQGDILIGSLLAGTPESALSFGVLSLEHGDGDIFGEYWLPTFTETQTERVALTVSFDDSTEAIALQFSTTDTALEFLPEIFSTSDGSSNTVQLVAQKLSAQDFTSDTDATGFFNSSSRAIQSEAKQTLRAMNRGQQAYYLEYETFTAAIAELGLGVQEETDNYMYHAHSANPEVDVHMSAKPKIDGLKSYVSGVFSATVEGQDYVKTQAILCESDATGIPAEKLPYPFLSETEPTCPEGFTAL